MKNIQFRLVMSFLMIAFFSSCAKTDTAVVVPATTTTSSIIVKGNWKITYYSHGGTDGTANYNGFKFLFMAGGAIAASNDFLAINGTWSTHNDDSQNKLLLIFPATIASIAALNHDWHIVEITSIKLRMEDVSGGAGGTDYLTIEKI